MTNPFIERKISEFDHSFGNLPEAAPLRDLYRISLTEALLEGIKLAEGCVPEELKDTNYIRNHTLPPHSRETLTNTERRGWNEAVTETLSKIQLLKESIEV